MLIFTKEKIVKDGLFGGTPSTLMGLRGKLLIFGMTTKTCTNPMSLLDPLGLASNLAMRAIGTTIIPRNRFMLLSTTIWILKVTITPASKPSAK